MSEDASDTPTPDGPGKIRLPSQLEVQKAVESTPTVQDDQKPDIALPEYLKPSSMTLELNLDTVEEPSTEDTMTEDTSTDATEEMSAVPGFTDRASGDPTEKEMKAVSLSAAVIERDEAAGRAPSAGTPWLWGAIAVAIVVAGAVIVMIR